MRNLLLSLVVAAFASAGLMAEEPKLDKPQPALKVGDPAPPIKATTWITGEEVKEFEPGKVYVVEFWATWCGPCVVMMPHLGDLQEELGPKGLTVIGFTAKDPRNNLDGVIKFVEQRGDKLGYTIAYAHDRETYDAYMKAAGQKGIPCSYLVGKDGKIAYIGHPLFLDAVLPDVLAGAWDATKGKAELEEAQKQFSATLAALSRPGDAEKQLAEWEAFASKWPRLAANPYMDSARLKVLIHAKRFGEARRLAESTTKKAVKRNDTRALIMVASTVSPAAGEAELAAALVQAADALVAIEGDTPVALIQATKAYAAAGDKEKTDQCGQKAVAAAEKALQGDKDARGTLQVAAAYDAAGNKEKAKETAEKALALVDPKDAMLKRIVEFQAKRYGAEPPKTEEKEEDKG